MQERAEQDGLCPKIRLSASTLLQAAAQMPEGKQAVRMVNREGEKKHPREAMLAQEMGGSLLAKGMGAHSNPHFGSA